MKEGREMEHKDIETPLRKDKFWIWYSEAWSANEELREQLHRATKERDEERTLRAMAEKRLVEIHMDKKIEYESLS